MNMVKLRQILELRRATKAPPLIPPKIRRGIGGETETRRGPKEIVDIHLQLKNLRVAPKKFSSKTNISNSRTIACVFSESEDGQTGPWKVSTASELQLSCQEELRSCRVDMPSVFAVEFQLERSQFIKLDVCDLFENQAISLGYAIFAVSELVVCENGSICRQVVNDEAGESIAEALISCTLRPKPHSVLLQFATKNLALKKSLMSTASTQIFFEIHRLELGPNYSSNGEDLSGMYRVPGDTTTSVLYRSESVKYSSSRIIWRNFCLQSTEIIGRILEVVCLYRDSKTSRGLLGRFLMEYEHLKKGPTTENVYFLIYENSRNQQKTCGTFELMKINEIALPSFLEFVSSGSALNFACAIDFSRPASQPVDEVNIRSYLDDVELCIRALGEPLRHFNASSSFPAFGFGAKIPPHFRESQEFCLNLDTDPYCRGLDGIQKAFKNAFASVQPLNVAHLSHVIYYVSKLAQSALNKNQPSSGGGLPQTSSSMGLNQQVARPSYFVLIVITRGVFDDLKETVQSIIFASRAPISVVFVGIGNATQSTGGTGESSSDTVSVSTASDLNELERLATAGTRLNYHGRKPERDCVQYVSLARCRREETKLADLKALIAERSFSTFPGRSIIADPLVFVSDEEAHPAEWPTAESQPPVSWAGMCAENPESCWPRQVINSKNSSKRSAEVEGGADMRPQRTAAKQQLVPLMAHLSMDSTAEISPIKMGENSSKAYTPQNTTAGSTGTMTSGHGESPIHFGVKQQLKKIKKLELDTFSISSLPGSRRLPSTSSFVTPDGEDIYTRHMVCNQKSGTLSDVNVSRAPNLSRELRSRSIQDHEPTSSPYLTRKSHMNFYQP
uniref:Copine C-terminal domain-containing protein n=1 Tax=Ditylenchus dipsaci TaxID=166011 RepID=A0A915CSX0_9BILA